MNTMRITLTPDLVSQIELIKQNEFPGLDFPEITKAVLSQKAALLAKNKKMGRDLRTMMGAEAVFSVDEDDQYEEPFWDESKVKPYMH